MFPLEGAALDSHGGSVDLKKNDIKLYRDTCVGPAPGSSRSGDATTLSLSVWSPGARLRSSRACPWEVR